VNSPDTSVLVGVGIEVGLGVQVTVAPAIEHAKGE